MAKFNAAKITSKMSKLAGNRYFVAIRDGMAVIIPVAIVGSFFTIISQFPIDSWKKFITPYLPALQVPVTFSIGMMALYSCYAMAAALAGKISCFIQINPLMKIFMLSIRHFQGQCK